MGIMMDAYREMISNKKSLLEAEGDEAGDNTPADTPAEGNEDNNTNDDAAANDGDMGEDDNFSIDADLDAGDDDTNDNPDDNDSGDNTSDMNTTSSGEEEPEEEVNDDNTDIFSTLTAEEQQMKIKELKSLYQQLYCSCDDVMNRLNKLDTNEKNVYVIDRISSSIYTLKKYIGDYLIDIFPNKSYIENDISFNKFLLIVQSISDIIDKYNTQIAKDLDR
jgi:hypothetical protein